MPLAVCNRRGVSEKSQQVNIQFRRENCNYTPDPGTFRVHQRHPSWPFRIFLTSSKMSSANRNSCKYWIVPSIASTRIHDRRLCHLDAIFDIAPSRTALKRGGEIGSPCFVPRVMSKVLRVTSVINRPTCDSYIDRDFLTYVSGTCCSIEHVQNRTVED